MVKAIESPAIGKHDLSEDRLRWMLRNMHLQRTLDNRGFQLNRQGKIPFALGSEGHEAIHAGAAAAFNRGKDLLVPYYRDLGLCVGIGMEPLDVLLSMFARAADRSGGRQFPNHYTNKALGLQSFSSIIAAHVPHAVGAAYVMKLRKEQGRAVLCTFGDGSTSEGEWHESINFAAIHKVPIVFLCENNEWAISTPRSKQMAARDIVDKAIGYGLPAMKIDGMDPIAVYLGLREALERARNGDGPTLVEAICYRFLSHTTDDDDRTYRSREEVEKFRPLDPVPRFEQYLTDNGIMTAADIEAMKREVLAEVNDVTDRAEAMPFPDASEMYANVYEGTHEPWL
ncbi:MAG: thiamine pyrophosphate-dependent dehydrogenase E1 component subunit alpha [Candidatus Eremiobacteraeota bacterium]|nr:thiamine pyrophosphate-dependent dehydrogenase E1 component subunit alpha [Candidatus Eremiobacteraeota bacterium]